MDHRKILKFAYMTQNDYFSFLVYSKDPVKVSSIPGEFYPDVEQFMFGKTCTMINGEIAYYPGDFNSWVDKVALQGLGYSVQLSTE